MTTGASGIIVSAGTVGAVGACVGSTVGAWVEGAVGASGIGAGADAGREGVVGSPAGVAVRIGSSGADGVAGGAAGTVGADSEAVGVVDATGGVSATSWTGGGVGADVAAASGAGIARSGVRVGAGRETAGGPASCGLCTGRGTAAAGCPTRSFAPPRLGVAVCSTTAAVGTGVSGRTTCPGLGVGLLTTTVATPTSSVTVGKGGVLAVGVSVAASPVGNGSKSMAIRVASSRPSSATICWRWRSVQVGSSDGGRIRRTTCTSARYALTSASCWVWESCGCPSAANATATRSFASADVIATGGADRKS